MLGAINKIRKELIMYKIISTRRLSNGAGGSDIYTKSGDIRKDCTVKEFEGTPEEAKEYLDSIKYQATGTPYIFTHIEGRDIFNCRSIVTQDVRGLMCSPVKLAELLGLK
jgi:hypothetical protein